MVTNEITIVSTSLESMGPIQGDGGTGVTVTLVPPRENGFSLGLGGVQMFLLELQMFTNEITIDKIFFILLCILWWYWCNKPRTIRGIWLVNTPI